MIISTNACSTLTLGDNNIRKSNASLYIHDLYNYNIEHIIQPMPIAVIYIFVMPSRLLSVTGNLPFIGSYDEETRELGLSCLMDLNISGLIDGIKKWVSDESNLLIAKKYQGVHEYIFHKMDVSKEDNVSFQIISPKKMYGRLQYMIIECTIYNSD